MRFENRYPLLVAGVSGSGKSTFGKAWAQRCAAPFIEGDQYHSPESVAKMREGIPLQDADRLGWLERLGAAARSHAGLPAPVLACSALKRSYRDRLRDEIPGLRIVLLEISHALAIERVAHRTEHYMPVTLVDSQFKTLEQPNREQHTVMIEGSRPIDELMNVVEKWLAPQ